MNRKSAREALKTLNRQNSLVNSFINRFQLMIELDKCETFIEKKTKKTKPQNTLIKNTLKTSYTNKPENQKYFKPISMKPKPEPQKTNPNSPNLIRKINNKPKQNTMLNNLTTFDEKGSQLYSKLVDFADFATSTLQAQPPATDGDAMAKYLQELQSVAATAAEMNGIAQGLEAAIFHHYIENNSDSKEFKAVKNSSTSTAKLIKGKYPKVTAIVARTATTLEILKDACFSYRTLISTQKEEKKAQAFLEGKFLESKNGKTSNNNF